jgi:hypothetical protein
MDLKDAEKHIDHADSFLTKLWKFLGNHWGKLIIIGIAYLTYKFVNLVLDEIENPTVQPVEEAIVVSEYYDYDTYGDTILVRSWSDGVIDTVYSE